MPTQDVWHFNLMGYNSSSMEALVWEELSNTPSICTTKSIQTAYTSGTPNGLGLKVETFTKSNITNIGTDLVAFNHSAVQIRADITNFVNQYPTGYSVRVPTSYTDVGTGSNKWHGIGYLITDANGVDISNIIDSGDGHPHGGWTGGNPDFVLNYPTQPVVWSGGTPVSNEVGDPIEIDNGNVTHDETDLSIPNLGTPLAFARHYASNTTVASGGTAWSDRGMGEGWSFTYGDSLMVFNQNIDGSQSAGTMVWFTGDGLRLIFTPTSLWRDHLHHAVGRLRKLGA